MILYLYSFTGGHKFPITSLGIFIGTFLHVFIQIIVDSSQTDQLQNTHCGYFNVKLFHDTFGYKFTIGIDG